MGNLDEAIEHLDRRLGLRGTVTPEAPDRHSRVYLDRSYVEVSVGAGGDRWSATMFFLRFDDPAALRVHLERAKIAYRFVEYEGVDGTWDDVAIRAAAYRRLLGDEAMPEAEEGSADGRRRLRLASGEIVLSEGRSGALGLVLGVPSLPTTRNELSGRSGRAEGGVAWLDPEEAFGLRLGFVALEPRPR